MVTFVPPPYSCMRLPLLHFSAVFKTLYTFRELTWLLLSLNTRFSQRDFHENKHKQYNQSEDMITNIQDYEEIALIVSRRLSSFNNNNNNGFIESHGSINGIKRILQSYY